LRLRRLSTRIRFVLIFVAATHRQTRAKTRSGIDAPYVFWRASGKVAAPAHFAIRKTALSLSKAATSRLAGACVALALLSSTPGVTQADAPPARKAGLWEVATSREGAPKMQMCLDADSQDKLNAMGKETMKELSCSKNESHGSGNVFTSDSVCKFLGSTQTSHSVSTFVGDTEYTTEISIHLDPPLKYRPANSKTTQHGRWLGPCGPDMHPGDMMMNGQKFHPGARP
jgi:hypothetical protein